MNANQKIEAGASLVAWLVVWAILVPFFFKLITVFLLYEVL